MCFVIVQIYRLAVKPKLGYVTDMTLERYLITKKISTLAFAKQGRFSFETVRKWRQGTRIPRIKSMLKIEKLTKGKVEPNDWYKKN